MNELKNLEHRIARLERQAAWPTIDDSLFSVDGHKPAKGKEIVREYRNKFKSVALEMALEKAFFEGEHRKDSDTPEIKLIKKQSRETERRTASEIIHDLEMRIAHLERRAKTMSKKDRKRLDELQLLEDQDRLTSSQNKEYEKLVEEYRLTDEYKSKQKTASTPVRRAADKVLKAMKEMEQELEKMPSFSRGKDPYYQDLAEQWYLLAMKVEEEVKHIAGAY